MELEESDLIVDEVLSLYFEGRRFIVPPVLYTYVKGRYFLYQTVICWKS